MANAVVRGGGGTPPISMSSEQDEIARLQAARQAHREDVGFASAAGDKETYGTGTPRSAYVDSLPAGSPADDDAPARTRANPLLSLIHI